MDKDEFARIKAEEKAHLQELRKLKTQFKEAQRTQKLRQAMAQINSSIDPDKVAESALDAELKADLPTEKDQALDLVKQFKIEMGITGDLIDEEEETPSVEKTIGKMPAIEAEQELEEEGGEEDVPEKTLGRIRSKVKRASKVEKESDGKD